MDSDITPLSREGVALGATRPQPWLRRSFLSSVKTGEVSKSFVCFGHSVCIVALFNSGSYFIVSINDFQSQLLSHRHAFACVCCGNEPFHPKSCSTRRGEGRSTTS